MLCVFCRQNTKANPCRFRHFFIYCWHDGSRLDSMAAVEKHMHDRHRVQKRRMAMYCGECGVTYQKKDSLSKHVCQMGFHLRRSKIVGYDKHSFNPCAGVTPLLEVQSLTTHSDVAATSLCSISPTSKDIASDGIVSVQSLTTRSDVATTSLCSISPTSKDIASDGIVSGYASTVSAILNIYRYVSFGSYIFSGSQAIIFTVFLSPSLPDLNLGIIHCCRHFPKCTVNTFFGSD